MRYMLACRINLPDGIDKGWHHQLLGTMGNNILLENQSKHPSMYSMRKIFFIIFVTALVIRRMKGLFNQIMNRRI